MMASNVTLTVDEILDQYQMNKLHELMPVIVIMSIACVLGIVGNSFTIAFYGFVAKQTSTAFLITSLALVDLLVCVQIIPHLAYTAIIAQFTNAAGCKLISFFVHWTLTTSAFTLWFIAIDRHRRVCCPSKTQVSLKGAKWAVVVIITISLLFSLREFVSYDIIKFPIENQSTNGSVAVAHLCTTTRDPRYRVSVTLFQSIDAVFIVTIIVTFCVTYGKIVWTLKKGGVTFNNDITQRDNKEGTEKETKSNFEPSTRELSLNEGSSTEYVKESSAKEDVSDSKRKHNNSKVKRPDKSITLMMFVVSLVFCFCFVPYFIVKIGIRSYKTESLPETSAGIQLVIRFVFINSVANPIVFCFFNPQFRRYIIKTCSRLKPGGS